MNSIVRAAHKQRADYTHKFNTTAGRHGWLRLTPAYSVKIVDTIIGRHEHARRVLDPFCGTATTALCAAYQNREGVSVDNNPFLVWFGQAKTACYADETRTATSRIGLRVLRNAKKSYAPSRDAPPIHNIERWWAAKTLVFLCRLWSAIEAETIEDSPPRHLLQIAFCRTLIELSNASFNHQSMSFKDDSTWNIATDAKMEQVFEDNVQFVIDGAESNPSGVGRVLLGDARTLRTTLDGTFDLVVTSPPYANRMSYIRELRPYMYWLGFLSSGRQAGELDWEAIGGTWGAATSKLSDWKPPRCTFRHALIDNAVEQIASDSHKNGALLANYITKYFVDMWSHISSLPALLAKNSSTHYIIGNSTFYGVLLPVEQIYVEMFKEAGFSDVRCKVIRKRNSKKELFEFDVSARWMN